MDFSILDLALCVILIGSGIIGYYKGAVNTLISFLGMIASFIVAGFFAPMITEAIVTSLSVQTYFSDQAAVLLLERLAATEWGALLLAESASQTQAVVSAALTPLMEAFIYGLVFLLVMLLAGLVIHWIKKAGCRLNHVPVLGFFNRLLGALLGGGMGVLLVVLITILSAAAGVFTGNLNWVKMLETGRLTGVILNGLY